MPAWCQPPIARLRLLDLDLDVDTGWQIQLGQRVHRLRTGIEDVWKRSPVSMETCGVPGSWKQQGWDLQYILREALRWHVSSLNVKSSAIPPDWKPAFEEFQKRILYAEPPLVFMNQTNGQFRDYSRMLGPDIQQKLVARGAAYADTRLIGYPDIAVSVNNGNAHLYRNSGGSNRSLRLELIGAKSNKSAIGAVVTVTNGDESRTYRVRSGSSYCSQSELPITIGLGSKPGPINVQIAWPYKSHPVTVVNDLKAGQYYKVHELLGIVGSRPLSAPSTK